MTYAQTIFDRRPIPRPMTAVDQDVLTYDLATDTWVAQAPSAGPGGGAPTTCDYLTKTAQAGLSAERVVTDSTSITWDWATVGQAIAKRAALTGDVTAAADSNATTIAALAVTDGKVAAANKDGASGTPSMRTLGTGAAQACAGNDSRLTDSRAPNGSASGDLGGTYPSPTVTQARGLRETAGPTTLAMGAVADSQLLQRVGSSIVGFTLPAPLPPDATYGQVAVSGTGTVWTLSNGSVTLAQLADIATARLMGRTTAGTGAPEALTAAQATAMLNAFTSALAGLVPPSGGGTTNFLRADGSWAAPPGGSSTWTETELDFGTAPVASKSFTVTDGTVSGTSKIVVMPSGNAPTGGYSDVWQWDAITLAAKAGTGSFTVHAAVGNGTTNGKHKVYYQVA